MLEFNDILKILSQYVPPLGVLIASSNEVVISPDLIFGKDLEHGPVVEMAKCLSARIQNSV